MIFIVSMNGSALVVLSPSDVKTIKEGGIINIPGGRGSIAFTPDMKYMVDGLKKLSDEGNNSSGGVTPTDVINLIREDISRPEIFDEIHKQRNPFFEHLKRGKDED